MFHLERGDGLVEGRLSSDLVLAENFLQILAHVLIQERIANPYPPLAVARELLRNAVIHGNGGREDLSVGVRVERLHGERWCITVTDEGKGFDYERLATGHGEGEFEARSSGFGLIRSLADAVSFEDGGRKVSVELTCARAPHSGRRGPRPARKS